jgi:hypothetical protein
MKDLTKNQPIDIPIPSRTGYTLLPAELESSVNGAGKA